LSGSVLERKARKQPERRLNGTAATTAHIKTSTASPIFGPGFGVRPLP
jgi:hypothetical protein